MPATAEIHRFLSSDLTTHSSWMLKRLVNTFPQKNEWGWANYLRGLCDRNDCLFLAQAHSVALAEIVQTDNWYGQRSVWERFVLCENPQDPRHIEEALFFYARFQNWAQAMGIDRVVVCRLSDVPTEMIKKNIGRIWNETIQYVNA